MKFITLDKLVNIYNNKRGEKRKKEQILNISNVIFCREYLILISLTKIKLLPVIRLNSVDSVDFMRSYFLYSYE